MMLGPGFPSNTFTIVGRCGRTGAIGIAISTCTIAVAARCSFVRENVGAVVTQAYAEPALGPLGLNLLELGFSPQKVISELESTDEWFQYRQIAIVDSSGNTAVFTGERNLEWRGHVQGEGHVALGNYLASASVVESMSEAFSKSPSRILEERLLSALEAGSAAGGDKGGQLSAGILTYGSKAYPRTDLRIDFQEAGEADPRDAVAALRDLFNDFKPLIEYYERKPDEPTLGSWRDWLASSPDLATGRETARNHV